MAITSSPSTMIVAVRHAVDTPPDEVTVPTSPAGEGTAGVAAGEGDE